MQPAPSSPAFTHQPPPPLPPPPEIVNWSGNHRVQPIICLKVPLSQLALIIEAATCSCSSVALRSTTASFTNCSHCVAICSGSDTR